MVFRRSKHLQHNTVVNDLTTLEYIDEVINDRPHFENTITPLFLSLLQNIIAAQLKERYLKGVIYTYVGDILVSVNPFHEMPELYSEEVHSCMHHYIIV